ncbi:hypothetical protein PsorP6_007635 [Peronosclerospora sorghi]|uniref:Uncharacterized protein n=1 Tax=Peronosclerospora sorghi TaxID=230839 RepID=A0ACC0WBJ3_9STRA|nr:hypothetical protein PsorP6_007635 [Peronosclerospora sorghi]
MSCANCSGELVIRTDPKRRGYEMVSGVQKKAEAEETEEIDTERLNEEGLSIKLRSDPFLRLEHEKEDKEAARKRSRGLETLIQLQDAEFKNDYASNSALRAQLRKQKKQRRIRDDEAKRLGIGISLAKVHPDDVLASKAVVFKGIPQRRLPPNHRRVDNKMSRFQTSANAGIVDSFQHFGDLTGSRLQCLKAAKLAAKKRLANLP